MRTFDAQKSGADVEDPYYDTQQGFENCYQVLKESTEGFLDFLIAKHQIPAA